MGYRKIKPTMLQINSLSSECGLFTCDTELNGGYGCKSKSIEKNEPGKCYSWDCPLAYTADLDDMKEHDIDIYNQWKEYCDSINSDCPESCGSEWVIQYMEVV